MTQLYILVQQLMEVGCPNNACIPSITLAASHYWSGPLQCSKHLIIFRENYVLMGQFGNNNIFGIQLSIIQDMSTVWKNIKGNMHNLLF